MVIASIMIGRKYKMSSKKTTKPPGRDYTKLAAKGEEQAQYAEAIKQKLDADTTYEGTAQERYKDILEIMKHAGRRHSHWRRGGSTAWYDTSTTRCWRD